MRWLKIADWQFWTPGIQKIPAEVLRELIHMITAFNLLNTFFRGPTLSIYRKGYKILKLKFTYFVLIPILFHVK